MKKRISISFGEKQWARIKKVAEMEGVSETEVLRRGASLLSVIGEYADQQDKVEIVVRNKGEHNETETVITPLIT